MTAAVDTSVLVAGVLARHEHHLPSRDELERLAASEPALRLPVHALLESYTVLTRLPAPHRIAPRRGRRERSFMAHSRAGVARGRLVVRAPRG